MKSENSPRVIIIGGGLAGLAAASALATQGIAPVLLESRQGLGGRAGSFTDAETGELIDACQHVSMGCCTNFAHFCRLVGIDSFLEPQPALYFMTPDRRVSRFRASAWPAPLHLAAAFLGLHFLTLGEKVRIGWALARLKRIDPNHDEPFFSWLCRHRQTRRAINRFWATVLVSALNETVDRVGLRYARKVFVDGFMTHRRGFEVQVPTVPLGRLYGEELKGWLKNHGVSLLTGQAVRRIVVDGERVAGVEMRDGRRMEADWYISTVPFWRLPDLLPEQLITRHDQFANIRHLQTSPITSVHLWYDRPLTTLPHVVLVDCLGQWLFNKGEKGNLHCVQVVISASHASRQMPNAELKTAVVAELERLFPPARSARLVKSRVVVEHRASFSAVPGVDRWRPAQETPLDNFFLAGDWTATGWPATMEGAVRSGYLAAQALLRRLGNNAAFLQPEHHEMASVT
jgi:squalene-associated FAD-dependent desaturase